jgi:hypothetical protein
MTITIIVAVLLLLRPILDWWGKRRAPAINQA